MNISKGSLSVERRANGGDVWVRRFYHTRHTDGKRVQATKVICTVARFPREADVWAEINRTQRVSPTITGRLTVQQLIDHYWEVEQGSLANSTQDLLTSVFDNYIAKRWANSYVDDVRVLDLKKWFIAVAKENELTAQTIQKIKQVFHRLYAFGAENELIPTNLNPLSVVNISGIGARSKSVSIVVDPKTSWQIAMDLSPLHRTLVLLAAGTGLRQSELLGRKWLDADYLKASLTLGRTWVAGEEGDGKSDESRKPVPLGALMIEVLKEWQGQTPYARPNDWIFASPKISGARPISGSQFVQDHLRPLLIKYGVISADYEGRAGLHAFRHSLSTILITDEKVDPKTAQGILRHANSSITMDVYTHAQEGAKRAALGKLESRLLQ